MFDHVYIVRHVFDHVFIIRHVLSHVKTYPQIDNNTVRKNTVVKIERHSVNHSANNKHFVLVLEISVLSHQEEKIGEICFRISCFINIRHLRFTDLNYFLKVEYKNSGEIYHAH